MRPKGKLINWSNARWEVWMCGFQGTKRTRENSGDNGERVPPVPIPNTEVKPFSADGTWLETARESRSLPDSKKKTPNKCWVFSFYPRKQLNIPRAASAKCSMYLARWTHGRIWQKNTIKPEHLSSDIRNNSREIAGNAEKQRKTGEERKFLFYIGAMMMYNTEVKAKW